MKSKVSINHIITILKTKLDELNVKPDLVIGIGRGGLVPAVYTAYHFDVDLTNMGLTSYTGQQQLNEIKIRQGPTINHCNHNNILIVDDINDTGNTFQFVSDYLTNTIGMPVENLTFLSIFGKRSSKFKSVVCEYIDEDNWICFPWEL